MVRSKAAKDSVHKHVRWLEEQIAELDDDIDTWIRSTPIFVEKAAIMRSVPGVGKVTVSTLLTELPELGKLMRKLLTTLNAMVATDSKWNSNHVQDGCC